MKSFQEYTVPDAGSNYNHDGGTHHVAAAHHDGGTHHDGAACMVARSVVLS